jgi:hypothetical protein
MRPLRRFLTELFILLAAFILIVVLVEWRYSFYVTDADILIEKFESRKPKAEYLFFGNSHTIPIVKADTLNHANASLASGGMDLFWITVLAKNYIKQAKNVTTIFAGIDEELLGYNQAWYRQEYISRSLYRYTDTLYQATSSEKWMAKSNFFRANRDLRFLFGTRNYSLLDKNLQETQVNLSACRSRAIEHSVLRFSKNLISENTRLLTEFIAICKKSNKKLVIFIPPKTPCYFEMRNKRNIASSRHVIDSLVTAEKIMLVDFTIDPDFTVADFGDPDHLNKTGGAKALEKLYKAVR